MLFTDEFVSTIKDDPVGGALAICQRAIGAIDEDNTRGWSQEEANALLEAYSLIVEVIDSKLLPIAIGYPKISGSLNDDCGKLNEYFREVERILNAETSKLKVESLRNRFRASLGNGFAYEFSQGDLDRVQHLLNQPRDQIANSHQLENEHQQRLLRRLERLQAELHKRVSDLDRFWGSLETLE